jgi:hypothetical protein
VVFRVERRISRLVNGVDAVGALMFGRKRGTISAERGPAARGTNQECREANDRG